jgi:subtilisin family serine protease
MRVSQAAVLWVLLSVACRDASSPVPLESRATAQTAASQVVPGQYVVVFKDAVARPGALAQALLREHGGSLRHTYTRALKGFAARLSDGAVAALRRHPLVAYVEPDQIVTLAGTQTMDANGDPWGLDRIDQRALPLSGTYTYTATGAGVHVYIIDSGIWTMHPEFEGRADNVWDVMGLDGEDCNGHGTHVAGIVGAATYGVAKKVFLHGVRFFFYCQGLGFTSDEIAAVDWVTANHVNPAVANISPVVVRDSALNAAVTGLWNSGVFVAVAAGNQTADACQYSPASATGSFGVAASAKTDSVATFANFGSCVKAYAPGVNILSTWLLNTTMTMSGCSMAAPHVAGVAALYKATFGDAPPDTIAKWIVTNATVGAIAGVPSGTPNLLLFTSF